MAPHKRPSYRASEPRDEFAPPHQHLSRAFCQAFRWYRWYRGYCRHIMLIMVVLIGGTTMTDWPWKTNLANTGPTGRYHPAAPNPVEYHRYHQSHQKN
jgi:hypothetical protein